MNNRLEKIILKRLQENLINVNQKYENNETLLSLASNSNYIEIFQELVSRNDIDVNSIGQYGGIKII